LEAKKLKAESHMSSKLKAQREASAVGGALRLRLEAEKVKLPFFLNQLINELTNQPDQVQQ
jgi:hypothetical protein